MIPPLATSLARKKEWQYPAKVSRRNPYVSIELIIGNLKSGSSIRKSDPRGFFILRNWGLAEKLNRLEIAMALLARTRLSFSLSFTPIR